MKPVLQALVLAEKVYEAKNGSKIIVGTFSRILVRNNLRPKTITDEKGVERPVVTGGQSGSPYAYISLTDVCNNTRLDLQFVSLEHNKVLFMTQLIVQCHDRLASVEFIAPLPPFTVDESGAYAFEIVCEGEVIGSHRLMATVIDEANERDQQ